MKLFFKFAREMRGTKNVVVVVVVVGHRTFFFHSPLGLRPRFARKKYSFSNPTCVSPVGQSAIPFCLLGSKIILNSGSLKFYAINSGFSQNLLDRSDNLFFSVRGHVLRKIGKTKCTSY